MSIKSMIYSLISITMLGSSSCHEIDNYELPAETVRGSVVDMDGRPVYANAGNSSVRIKMLDYGYSETPSEYYLNVATDGSYINNKVFESTYTMVPQGPFVPVEGHQNITISGDTEINFEVEPFFVVEWGEPALTPNANGTVTARVRVSRGTDDAAYQDDVTQVIIFISTTQYVGSNNYDQRISTVLTGSTAAAFLDTEAEITSLTSGSGDDLVALKSGFTYYVRIGVRSGMSGEIPGAYNFSAVQKITMP